MSRFDPSYPGLGELLISPEMQAAMHDLAKKAKDAAVATSPVGPPSDPHRELYRDSWETDSGIQDGPTRRAYGEVSNPVDYAASIEFGNGRGTEAHYVLTRAIDMIRE